MDRAPFNRLNMATDLTKRTTCAKCGKVQCSHSDSEWKGEPHPDGLANAVETSGAVQHRSGLYSDGREEPAR
jgi:hypothetical protein